MPPQAGGSCPDARSLPLQCPSQLVGAGLSEPAAAVVHAPMSLLPVPYPRETLLRAQQAAEVFNLVVDRVSQDEEYLQTVLAPAAQYDDFTVGSTVCAAVLRVAAGGGHNPCLNVGFVAPGQ